MTNFSLSWDSHEHNICKGLTALQQNGEFVDMTLAAAGHHVKVHQMIMSLASPYLKDLIISAKSAHPIIILNKISYPTMCAILEYIYTGEVLVPKDRLNDLIDAGRELHIKGLENMKLELSGRLVEGQPLSDSPFYRQRSEASSSRRSADHEIEVPPYKPTETTTVYLDEDNHANDTSFDDVMEIEQDLKTGWGAPTSSKLVLPNAQKTDKPTSVIQYTISNQGSLQMILNRYMYALGYSSRRAGGHRRWYCVDKDNNKIKCPATVVTRDDMVVQRIAAHSHSFHDMKILKKVRDGLVFSALHEAEDRGRSKTQQRNAPVETAITNE